MAGEPGSVNYLHAFLSPSIILGKNSLAPTSDLCRCPSLEHLRKDLRHQDVLLRGAGQAGM